MHGWTIFAHPSFLEQLERSVRAVEAERSRGPTQSADSANAKVLASIAKLILDIIPVDPTLKEYTERATLGPQRKHWFRAKFGGGRFRLFFRYRADVRIIVYAWINDETTLRTYGKRSDAYATFARVLGAGNPPDVWDMLLAAASEDSAITRTARAPKRLK